MGLMRLTSEEFRGKMHEYFFAAVKLRQNWLLGVELECTNVLRNGFKPLPFTGDISVQALLNEFSERFGWEKVYYEGNLLALKRGEENITLEPAGQIELGSKPCRLVSELYDSVERYELEIRQLHINEHLLHICGGINPFHLPDEMDWLPKKRYQMMRDHFSRTGALGGHMMSLTSAVQVSLDFADEEDCQRKVRTAAGLVPLFTAMYANSPIHALRKTGFVSYRGHIWTHTDPGRCGVPDFFFDEGPFFDNYIDYALDVPMLFYRDSNHNNELVTAYGRSFREMMLEHDFDLDDWLLHLSTIFTEVRMKNLIEVRTPDGNPLPLAISFAALCKGLFYCADACEAAWDLVSDLSLEERHRGHEDATAFGLSKARLGEWSVLDLSRELLHIAEDCLKRMDHADDTDDSRFLEPLQEQVFERGCSPGEELLNMWEGPFCCKAAPLMHQLSK